MRGNITRLIAAAALLCLAVPAAASANTYCVGDAACVSAGGSEEGKEGAGLIRALASAAAHTNVGGPDVIMLGPGLYANKSGFAYSGDPVLIEGAGRGSTFIENTEKNSTAFSLASAGSVLSAVTIVTGEYEQVQGLALDGGTLERSTVTWGGSGSNFAITGVALTKGSVVDDTIEMNSTVGTSVGVDFEGSGEVIATTIEASYGVQGAGGTATIAGSRISSTLYGVQVYYTTLMLEDTLIDLRGREGWGVSVVSNHSGKALASLRGLSIVNGGSGSIGVEAQSNEKTTATVALESSVISGYTHPIFEHTNESGSKVSVATSYSSFEAAGDQELAENSAKTPEAPTALGDVGGNPDFNSPVSGAEGFLLGDWRPRAGSPLIDAGSPAALAAGEYAFDAEGRPRIVNGRRDIGAFEYQRQAPSVTGTVSSAAAALGQPLTFTGSAAVTEPGDAISSYQWTFDEGAAAPGSSATHAFATDGVHRATLTATDAAGISVSTSVTVTVTGSAPTSAPIPISASLLKLSPSRFRAARSGGSLLTGPHGGTVISFDLSVAGTVALTVDRVLAGHVHGHGCAAGAPARGGRRCSLLVAVRGGITDHGTAGSNRLHFSGRLAGHALAPGSYELRLAVSGSASRPLTVAFVVPR